MLVDCTILIFIFSLTCLLSISLGMKNMTKQDALKLEARLLLMVPRLGTPVATVTLELKMILGSHASVYFWGQLKSSSMERYLP